MEKQTGFYKALAGSLLFIFTVSGIYGQVPKFTRIDTGSLVSEAIRGRGLYVVDYDMDGLLDLYIGNSTGVGGTDRPNLMFRNGGSGIFTKTVDPAISSRIYKWNSGCNWADIDNDGDPDMCNEGEVFLNDGTGSFTLGSRVTERPQICAIWLDLDNDGYVDLLTDVYMEGNFAYKNLGNGLFKEIILGDFNTKGIGGSQSFSMADADNDGDMDILEANLCLFDACDPLIPNTLYINNNDMTLTALDPSSGLTGDVMQSPGSSWGDYDNDGDMDIYVLSMTDKRDMLFRNDGNLKFTGICIDPEKAGNKWPYNSSWGDLNNDGYLDLFVSVVPDGNLVNEECSWFNNMMYMNRGDGTFLRVRYGDIINDGGEPHVSNDFDNDGDLDIIIGHGNLNPFLKVVYIYLNNGNKNHWLNISCEGTISNRSAIGTRVKVKAKVGETYEWMMREISQENGIHACNGPRLHFGLGEAEKADSVIIRWPSGKIDRYTDINANHFYEAIEGQEIRLNSKIENR
ncbi:MAG: CRTAC1 family protein [Bacteroidales bacterium]|nr:CRTAC1 family protein [Bacteroidales bacterium]